MYNEKEKYLSLYSGFLGSMLKIDKSTMEYKTGGYGRNFWGKGVINFLIHNEAKSICDIGCGYGIFCNVCTTFAEKVIGVDIASVETGNVISNPMTRYISADAANTGLETGLVEWVTSFDCLEHIPEDNIDNVLDEMRRIATVGMIVCISDEPHEVAGFVFHNTIHPIEWWEDKLKKYGMPQRIGSDPYRGNPYIFLRFNDTDHR